MSGGNTDQVRIGKLSEIDEILAATTWGEWSTIIASIINSHVQSCSLIVNDNVVLLISVPFIGKSAGIVRQTPREKVLGIVLFPPENTPTSDAVEAGTIEVEFAFNKTPGKDPILTSFTKKAPAKVKQRIAVYFQKILTKIAHHQNAILINGAEKFTPKRPVPLPRNKMVPAPIIIEPKLDGMMCITVVDGAGNTQMYSRHAQPIDIPRLRKKLGCRHNCIYIGELLDNGDPKNQAARIAGNVNKNETDDLHLILYDFYPTAENYAEIGYVMRYKLLCEAVAVMDAAPDIQVIDCAIANTAEELEEARAKIQQAFGGKNFEGWIYRAPDEKYGATGQFFKEKIEMRVSVVCTKITPTINGCGIVCHGKAETGANFTASLVCKEEEARPILDRLRKDPTYVPWDGPIIARCFDITASGGLRSPRIYLDENLIIIT